jgi:general nucleoside transport system permease protein
MSELEPLLTTSFLVGVLAAGVRLAVPILLAALGEIVTERAGVLNLGLEGIMLAGALVGFMATGWAEHGLPAAAAGAAPWLGLGAGVPVNSRETPRCGVMRRPGAAQAVPL